MNLENVQLVIDAIERNPACWDQTQWHCNQWHCETTHCFFGLAQIMSGAPEDSETVRRDARIFLDMSMVEANYFADPNRTLGDFKAALANRDAYDSEGFDSSGYDRYGYDQYGYDSEGFDSSGYDLFGYDRSGYDRSGYDPSGYDRSGYDSEGYSPTGYDREGYDREGYDVDSLDRMNKPKWTIVLDGWHVIIPNEQRGTRPDLVADIWPEWMADNYPE